MAEFEYGGWYKGMDLSDTVVRENIGPAKKATVKIKVQDLMKGIPDFIKDLANQKDVLFFSDPPCSNTNIRTFFTKAEKDAAEAANVQIDNFNKLYSELLLNIKPKWVFMEVFKANKQFWEEFWRANYKYVEIVESTYYYQEKNKCYIICASNEKPISEQFPDLPGFKDNQKLDEELFIRWMCKTVPFDTSFDCCSGQGILQYYSTLFDKNSVGTELNHKRAGMLLHRLDVQPSYGDNKPSKIK